MSPPSDGHNQRYSSKLEKFVFKIGPIANSGKLQRPETWTDYFLSLTDLILSF